MLPPPSPQQQYFLYHIQKLHSTTLTGLTTNSLVLETTNFFVRFCIGPLTFLGTVSGDFAFGTEQELARDFRLGLGTHGTALHDTKTVNYELSLLLDDNLFRWSAKLLNRIESN